jgi:MSHA pilin protein MshA
MREESCFVNVQTKQTVRTGEFGFTMIELVMVIVILGILSVTATPKFTSLIDEADRSAARGLAGALSSAASMNYAVCKTGNADCLKSTTTPAYKSCAGTLALLPGQEAISIAAKYIITGVAAGTGTDPDWTATTGLPAGSSNTCYIFKRDGALRPTPATHPDAITAAKSGTPAPDFRMDPNLGAAGDENGAPFSVVAAG